MQKTQGEFSGKEKNLFLRIKNKFIIIVILLIIIIVGVGFNKNDDINRDSDILLINGNATLNDIYLNKKKKEIIKVGDVVETIGKDSLVILEWGDGSLTRLGGNSSIRIDNLYLSNNLDKINIGFELLSGKSWSNVISFLGKGSYFNLTFSDNVAAVRGTIFDVDLDKGYLYVIDHKIKVTKKNGEVLDVNQNEPLNIKTFNFIGLEIFLKSFKDKTWEKINRGFDKDYLKILENKIQQNLDTLVDVQKLNINKIVNKKQKQELYNKLLTDYQKLNFIKPNNVLLFKKKIELKEALIKLANNDNKVYLIENTFYDFKNIIKDKRYNDLDLLLPILGDNKDLLNKLNFNKIVNFDLLPNTIKNKFTDLKILIIDTSRNIDTKIKNQFDNIKNINLINK